MLKMLSHIRLVRLPSSRRGSFWWLWTYPKSNQRSWSNLSFNKEWMDSLQQTYRTCWSQNSVPVYKQHWQKKNTEVLKQTNTCREILVRYFLANEIAILGWEEVMVWIQIHKTACVMELLWHKALKANLHILEISNVFLLAAKPVTSW